MASNNTRPPVLETNFDLEEQDALVRQEMARSRLSLNTIITNPDKGTCDKCLTRIPYATLIATIQCALGVVIFCGTMYRGATLAVLMFSDVFKMQLFWVDAVKMTFVFLQLELLDIKFIGHGGAELVEELVVPF